MPDAGELIRQDRRKVEALFEQYRSGDISVVPKICLELVVHTKIEEEILYAALDDVTDGATLRKEAEEEHRGVQKAISQVRGGEADPLQVEACMDRIMHEVTHHVHEEESDILPKMEKELGHVWMTELGQKIMSAKREQLVAAGEIGDLTKDELYALAKAAEIPHRSDMNKEQLIEALSA